MEETYGRLLKLVVIGDAGVGKTCLLLRFAEDVFERPNKATIGDPCPVRTIEIDGKKIKLQIWDTAGQEGYRSITRCFLRGASGFLLMYDITRESSLNCVRDWIRDLEEHAPAEAEKIILGNKCDLNDRREVSREAGEKFALDYGIKFLETSAKSSINVEEAFFTLAADIMSRLSKKTSDCNPSAGGPVDISESQSKSLFCCCPWY